MRHAPPLLDIDFLCAGTCLLLCCAAGLWLWWRQRRALQRLLARAMRFIVHDLHAEALESGLEATFQQQIAQFTRLSGIPCQLEAAPGTAGAGTALTSPSLFHNHQGAP